MQSNRLSKFLLSPGEKVWCCLWRQTVEVSALRMFCWTEIASSTVLVIYALWGICLLKGRALKTSASISWFAEARWREMFSLWWIIHINACSARNVLTKNFFNRRAEVMRQSNSLQLKASIKEMKTRKWSPSSFSSRRIPVLNSNALFDTKNSLVVLCSAFIV